MNGIRPSDLKSYIPAWSPLAREYFHMPTPEEVEYWRSRLEIFNGGIAPRKKDWKQFLRDFAAASGKKLNPKSPIDTVETLPRAQRTYFVLQSPVRYPEYYPLRNEENISRYLREVALCEKVAPARERGLYAWERSCVAQSQGILHYISPTDSFLLGLADPKGRYPREISTLHKFEEYRDEDTSAWMGFSVAGSPLYYRGRGRFAFEHGENDSEPYFPPIPDERGTLLDTSGEWAVLGDSFPLAKYLIAEPEILKVSWKYFGRNWKRYVLKNKPLPKTYENRTGPTRISPKFVRHNYGALFPLPLHEFMAALSTVPVSPASSFKSFGSLHFQKCSFVHLDASSEIRNPRKAVSPTGQGTRYKFGIEAKDSAGILRELIAQVERHMKQIRPALAKGRSVVRPIGMVIVPQFKTQQPLGKLVEVPGEIRDAVGTERWPCKFSDPNKTYPPHDFENGKDLNEEQLAKWMDKHKVLLRPATSEDQPASILPGSCPECGCTVHTIKDGAWVCADCDHEWRGEAISEPDTSEDGAPTDTEKPLEPEHDLNLDPDAEENPETGQELECDRTGSLILPDGSEREHSEDDPADDIFELTEYQTASGPVIAHGYQEKKVRRGNRKEPLLTWPEELKLIKRLYPQAVSDRLADRNSPDRTTAERLVLIRYCFRQVQGGMSDKAIAQQFKQRGRNVSTSTIKSDRHRLDKIIKRVFQLKAENGAYFTLPEVADKTGIPQSEIILWLKSGWIEGTSIDAEGEGLEIYPWWILSLKQMVTLADKWEKRAEPVVL